MNKSQTYFDPETLASISPFSLRVRTLIEGLVAGLHRSPLRGHSIEFAQHREYVPGDDVRQVDWKVYARSDRYYLKQYEDETNLTCCILLDQSESMMYKGVRSPLSKLDYARLIACSISYLVISQQDSAGLATFSSKIDHWLPASTSQGQLDDILQILEQAQLEKKTCLHSVMNDALRRLSGPSLILLISDLLCDKAETLQAIKLARFAGHDVMVLHVLDDDEISFPFDEMSNFEGLEESVSLTTDPMLIAGAYRAAAAEFVQQLQTGCQQWDADYFLINTLEPLSKQLPDILANRQLKNPR